jgi:hypothetical protein
MALRPVLDEFPHWVKGLRNRLLDGKDWSAAESALAEIRACGDLLRAGFSLEIEKASQANNKPEFHATANGKLTIVEVWNRNLANSQGPTGHPFGPPNPEKEGDSVLSNVIQRVAAIKEREHQSNELHPFVIWADLQSVETMRFDYKEHLLPLMTWNGALESGGYWHALYGRKGDRIAEMSSGRTQMNRMQHEGRFYQKMKHGGPTRISAFVFASPTATAVLENPVTPNPLPSACRQLSVELPRFDITLSQMDWSEGIVAKTVAVQREMIEGVLGILQL